MRLRIGYLPLTDAAALVVAAERGFAAAQGLGLELQREGSWATLRDRLALGRLDGAHLLAPLAVAANAGLSGVRAALAAPFALNLNGNAVTVSARLWAELEGEGAGGDTASVARAFAAVARARRAAGRRLRLATVFPFSTHTEQLALLFEAGGLALEEAAEVLVVPPPHMVEALKERAIDGFCVGSPWNSVAVGLGVGRIALFGSDLKPRCPEKVLAVPAASAGSPETAALVRALKAAADWCAEPGNRAELAALLAEPRHLGIPAEAVLRTLHGRLVVDPAGLERSDPAYLVLGGEACRPDPADEAWIRERLRHAGRPADGAPAVYRPDAYDAALA